MPDDLRERQVPGYGLGAPSFYTSRGVAKTETIDTLTRNAVKPSDH